MGLMHFGRTASLLFAIIAWLGLGADRTPGQATVRLTGVVKDTSGSTVPGALVALTNSGTNANRTTKTESDGTYLFSLVDVGTYSCLAYNTTTVLPGSPASFGDMGRNAIYGPGINNWDISFLKRFQFTETRNLEFRAEMFNAFNHAQFLNPDNRGNSGTFGQMSQDRGPRLVQFGLKYYY